jgi:predicted transcriptional regulator
VKLNKNLIALVLAFVIALSLAGLLQKQHDAEAAFQATAHDPMASPITRVTHCNLNYPALRCNAITFTATFNLQGTAAERTPLAENCTRTEIFNFITANPGVQFRAICTILGLPIGVVQFHIAILQKAGLINAIRRGRYKRFFAAGSFTRKQMETLAALRLSTVKNILKTLLNGKAVSHHELASCLSISSQGLTWQMNRLRETGLIMETRDGLNVTYALSQAQVPLVAEMMTFIE